MPAVMVNLQRVGTESSESIEIEQPLRKELLAVNSKYGENTQGKLITG